MTTLQTACELVYIGGGICVLLNDERLLGNIALKHVVLVSASEHSHTQSQEWLITLNESAKRLRNGQSPHISFTAHVITVGVSGDRNRIQISGDLERFTLDFRSQFRSLAPRTRALTAVINDPQKRYWCSAVLQRSANKHRIFFDLSACKLPGNLPEKQLTAIQTVAENLRFDEQAFIFAKKFLRKYINPSQDCRISFQIENSSIADSANNALSITELRIVGDLKNFCFALRSKFGKDVVNDGQLNLQASMYQVQSTSKTNSNSNSNGGGHITNVRRDRVNRVNDIDLAVYYMSSKKVQAWLCGLGQRFAQHSPKFDHITGKELLNIHSQQDLADIMHPSNAAVRNELFHHIQNLKKQPKKTSNTEPVAVIDCEKPVSQWNPPEVQHWMSTQGPKFAKQAPAFAKITGPQLLLFDGAEDLSELMSTATNAARKAFFKKIVNLKKARGITAEDVQRLKVQHKSGNSASVIGLCNIGNTCFMNSSIQVLLQTPHLAPFLLNYARQCLVDNGGQSWQFMHPTTWGNAFSTPKHTPKHLSTNMISALALLLMKARNSTSTRQSTTPTGVYSALRKYNPNLCDRRQHDSYESLRCILSAIDSNINGSAAANNKQVKLRCEKSLKQRFATVDAEDYFLNEMLRNFNPNRSIVRTCMGGILRHVRGCLLCGHEHVSYETVRALYVPISKYQTHTIPISVYLLGQDNQRRQLDIEIECSASDSMAVCRSRIFRELLDQSELNLETTITVNDIRIGSFFADTQQTSINEWVHFASEHVDGKEEKETRSKSHHDNCNYQSNDVYQEHQREVESACKLLSMHNPFAMIYAAAQSFFVRIFVVAVAVQSHRSQMTYQSQRFLQFDNGVSYTGGVLLGVVRNQCELSDSTGLHVLLNGEFVDAEAEYQMSAAVSKCLVAICLNVGRNIVGAVAEVDAVDASNGCNSKNSNSKNSNSKNSNSKNSNSSNSSVKISGTHNVWTPVDMSAIYGTVYDMLLLGLDVQHQKCTARILEIATTKLKKYERGQPWKMQSKKTGIQLKIICDALRTIEDNKLAAADVVHQTVARQWAKNLRRDQWKANKKVLFQNIGECMANYLSPQMQDIPQDCQQCHFENTAFVSQTSIAREATNLVVRLKRSIAVKIEHDMVSYSCSQPLCVKNIAAEESKYYLYGVICHQGKTGKSGHYFAHVKSLVNEQWYYTNDESARKTSQKHVMSSSRNAILLAYNKRS